MNARTVILCAVGAFVAWQLYERYAALSWRANHQSSTVGAANNLFAGLGM